jgi:FMN reductase [NAD(P)H]
MTADLFEILEERVTCRSFEDRDIPERVMEQLYGAACSSASSGGFQRVSIIEVREAEAKRELSRLSRNQGFIAQAPLNLIFCADDRRMMRIAEHEYAPYEARSLARLWMGIVDAAIAAQTLALCAEALGLGSCYNGNVMDGIDELGTLLKLPEGVVPIIMLTVGYPKIRAETSPKYNWKIFVHNERYHDLPIGALYEAHVQKSGRERYPLNERHLDKLRKAAARHGLDYAERAVRRAREDGGMSALQYWFGCYYPDGKSVSSKAFWDYLKKQGYDVNGERAPG